MNRLLIATLLLCIVPVTKAQQEFHTIMHNFIPQLHQVAYGATQEEISMTLLYCNQWKGIEGNPQNILFSGHSKISSKRLYIGTIVNQEKCGIKKNNTAEVSFSYGLRLKKHMLALGVGVSLNSIKWDVSSLSDEEVCDLIALSKTPDCRFFSFRTGLYLKSENFYFGTTISNLSRFKSNFHTPKPHGYISSGHRFYLAKTLFLHIDCNMRLEQFTGYYPEIITTIESNENLFAGFSYRIEKNIGFHIKINFSKHLHAGAAYELAANALKKSRAASTFEFIFGFSHPLTEEPVANWDKDRLLF